MGTPWRWLGFNLFVLIAIALDLGVFRRHAHKIRLREAAIWSLLWVALAMAFGLGILHWRGAQRALEYFTGYLVEESLSVDNLFIFVIIFRSFGLEPRFQQRVLGWGILGALLMRGALIAAGAALLHRFSWVMYVFGAILIYAGAHMLFAKKGEAHPEKNPVFRYASRRLRVTKEFRGEHFFVRENGHWLATPLFLVLLVVEITDVTFALDSIPAIFGITRDAFIVYTSNVFAILGLRTLYFLMAGALNYLRYLRAGLAIVLLFIGTKMFAEPGVHIPVYSSLLAVVFILAVAMAASLLTREPRREM